MNHIPYTDVNNVDDFHTIKNCLLVKVFVILGESQRVQFILNKVTKVSRFYVV